MSEPKPSINLTPERLYLTWSYPGGPVHTRGFPIEDGCVVFADADELLDTVRQMGLDPDVLPSIAAGTWDSRCIPAEMIPGGPRT